ncbi:hypothetical protein A9Q87_12485 [Flavobacteriales bacterium 34_180_T64]|nr:hypothetical protein A9Q87_12485 [Flavobacteriales bacterium 34_180_T64]
MTVLDSPLSKNVQATYCLDIGDFHFFDNFIVAEFKQGSYVSFNDFKEIFDLSREFFEGKPSGIISNRVNSYSINLLDIVENRDKLAQLSAYAIVTYSHNTKRMLAIEDYYHNSKRERFNSLIDAAKWMTKELLTIELNKFRQP